MNFSLLFLFSAVLLTVNAYRQLYTNLRGQVTCNGIPFRPSGIDLYDGNSADRPHDLLNSAWLHPMKSGWFDVFGEDSMSMELHFYLAIKHSCKEDKSIKEYAKKVHDYPEGVLYLNQEQIDRIIYAGERCVHTVEIPHQFISNNYSFHDLGSIELTETVCVGKLYYGNVASLNKKLLLEIKNLVSRV